MKILIACDKFRGSLEGLQVSSAIKKGMLEVLPDAEIQLSEIADGGEGSLELLSNAYECTPYSIEVNNAIGEVIESSFGYNEKTGIAVLEMASYVGLAQLPREKQDPLKTSSFGLGEAIKEAIKLGAKKIILGIGGSATNDGGAGMLYALGFLFVDNMGRDIYPEGGNLDQIELILFPQVKIYEDVELIIASDVNNPIAGPSGATYTYGPQKGASKADLEKLESNMIYYAEWIQRITTNDVFAKESYGAAGGIPLSACELLGATVASGSELIFEELGLGEVIKESDVVITGEGKIDHQTVQGKAISPIVKSALELNKSLFLACGIYEDPRDGTLEKQPRYELAQLAQEMKLDSFKDAEMLCIEVGKRIAEKIS